MEAGHRLDHGISRSVVVCSAQVNSPYDAYFGRGKPLPFGQVYATLARLARDGKVWGGKAEPGADPDRKRYRITKAGKSDVETRLAEPVEPEPHLQTLLFAKVVLSLMLGRPAGEYLDMQRAAHLARMRELTELKQRGNLIDMMLADHAPADRAARRRVGLPGRPAARRRDRQGPGLVPRAHRSDRRTGAAAAAQQPRTSVDRRLAAGQVGVSRAALARRFTEQVGEPPMAFLTGWRLALATDLLLEPDVTVGAVARKVGYGSPFTFSTAFKRHYGRSPQRTGPRTCAITPRTRPPERDPPAGTALRGSQRDVRDMREGNHRHTSRVRKTIG